MKWDKRYKLCKSSERSTKFQEEANWTRKGISVSVASFGSVILSVYTYSKNKLNVVDLHGTGIAACLSLQTINLRKE